MKDIYGFEDSPKPDDKTLFEMTKISAEAGNVASMIQLAKFYKEGIGCN